MTPEIIATQDGALLVDCHSVDGLVHFRVALNFAEERLQFDLIKGVLVRHDGTPSGPRHAADRGRLMKGLCLNGQFEIWDADKAILLGRTDPFLRVNIDTRATIENLDREIERFELVARDRGCRCVGSSVSVSADGISPAITEIESPLNNGDNVPSPIMTMKEGRICERRTS